jgi:hypothetical protein
MPSAVLRHSLRARFFANGTDARRPADEGAGCRADRRLRFERETIGCFSTPIRASCPDDGDFAMGDDLLVPRVLKVLLSLPAATIDFTAHGMHVSGGGYGMVVYYIGQGWIKLRTARLASQITSGAEAQYDHSTHILWFPRDTYGSRPEERASILHESTHALRDIMASPAFRREGMYGSKIAGQLHFDNEAAAYIAASLFYIYDNGVEWPVSEGDAAEIYRAANAIARGLKDKKGALVDETDFTDLRAKISLEATNAGVASPNDPDDIGRW